jgi:hypothetical protein
MAPLRDARGFGSIVRDNDAGVVTLYWKGEVPPSVQGVQEHARQSAVDFRTEEAIYTATELQAAAESVKAEVRQEGLPVTAISFAPDNTMLTIEMSESATRSAERTSQVKAAVRSVSKVPVKYRSGRKALIRARNNMEAPFKAGGVLQLPAGWCTSGFAVTVGGAGRLLSAGHCASTGNPARIENGDGTETITNAPGQVDVAPAYDSLLIDPVPSPATIGQVFDGGLNTNTKIDVAGWSPADVGDNVCVSGANTGGTASSGNCEDAVVYESTQFRCGSTSPYDQHWCNGFRARTTTSGRVIGGAGDSGAAVYVRRSDGKAGARGIYVSGVAGFQDFCRVIRHGSNTSTSCDTRINVVGIGSLLGRWDARLETN